MGWNMKNFLIVCVVLVLAGVSERAFAQSIGTYSGCKKLSGSTRKACESCVGGGNFYQAGSKTCGMAPGMKKSKPVPTEKLPPKPKSMPKVSFATVPAGSFKIGAKESEQGASDKEVFDSTVTITRPFLMQTTEVSQAQWYFVTGELSPSYEKACGLDCAVGFVTWKAALEYLNALSKREGLEQCYDISDGKIAWTKGLACTGYRLPTEAEWEYAARAGTEGAQYGELDEVAWYYENSNGEPAKGLGKKKPNAYGLYDMLGSQWEWAWDAEDYKPFAGKMADPITGGLETEELGTSRIVRGGSYRDSAMDVRAGHRYQYPASGGDKQFGFRPVRTVTKK
jgi:formylglycine-generating enzyme